MLAQAQPIQQLAYHTYTSRPCYPEDVRLDWSREPSSPSGGVSTSPSGILLCHLLKDWLLAIGTLHGLSEATVPRPVPRGAVALPGPHVAVAQQCAEVLHILVGGQQFDRDRVAQPVRVEPPNAGRLCDPR